VKNIYAALVLTAIATTAFAGNVVVPEIDGSTAASAITLISGAALVLRRRRRS
jgi:LPXTG-motif cell wall-anchored protein